ncbi:hypothetical protein VTJ83DRAFT_4529 [Remersonia thermophila]|uniref:Uncharacterized protein n=1 Tax=Remersonia thermophila TaxID=72144 RepID=A0ABR4DAF5_9PEZI
MSACCTQYAVCGKVVASTLNATADHSILQSRPNADMVAIPSSTVGMSTGRAASQGPTAHTYTVQRSAVTIGCGWRTYPYAHHTLSSRQPGVYPNGQHRLPCPCIGAPEMNRGPGEPPPPSRTPTERGTPPLASMVARTLMSISFRNSVDPASLSQGNGPRSRAPAVTARPSTLVQEYGLAPVASDRQRRRLGLASHGMGEWRIS